MALPIQTYQLYFIKAAQSPEYYDAFRSDLTPVSEYLKAHGNREHTYLILDKFSVQTTDYLTTKEGQSACDRDPAYRPSECVDNPINRPYTQVDPEDSWKDDVYTYGFKTGDEIVFTESSLFDIVKFKQYHPNVKLETFEKDKFGRYIMAVYVVK